MYIFTGFDDFIWDMVTVFKRLFHKTPKLQMQTLDSKPPKLIAFTVAAWHEENVLFDVIENIIVSQHYPKSMYHIFIGVYPNDAPTIEVAKALEEKYSNVHCIINHLPGPTSKAQNINYVISKIKDFEKEKGWRFAALTIHDSEDLVHPYELKVTNYLIDEHPALQFHVFPLIKKPTVWNFFNNITSNTYADEFAENHFITMVGRHKSGAFVPSAGTGFSLSRDTIESLGEEVLPENSLTEDYRLSLTLYEKGVQMYYVLEKVQRYNAQDKFIWDYIATRSMFPNTFKTAVKQKTRWTLGITMQSYRMRDLLKSKISFVGRYSLYRDQKAKFGNLLSVVGYPVLFYFIISWFYPLTAIYPVYSFSWYLGLLVTLMMLERQFFRGIALYNIYGKRSVFFGCLYPPIVPFRIVWGNLINFVSTVRASLQFFSITPFKSRRKKVIKKIQAEEMKAKEVIQKENKGILTPQEKKFNWSKTEHSFLEKEILSGYHRKLGYILVEKGFLSPTQIKEQLKLKDNNTPLGKYILEKNIITEKQLVEALASVKRVPFLREEALEYYNFEDFASEFDKDCLYELQVLPLLKFPDGYVFAYSDSSPADAQSTINKKLNKKLHTVLATEDTIKKGLDLIWNQKGSGFKESQCNLESCKSITSPEQVIIIKNYAGLQNKDEKKLAEELGFCRLE